MRLVLKGKPNEKQEKFFLSMAQHTAYGGARGGGKSWAMRRKLVLLALRYEGLKILLLRRTLPELRENHLVQLREEIGGAVKYMERERCFVFPNGSRLKLGYCDNEGDVLQYQGQEYDVIGLEEATHFTEYQRDFLMMCNRTVRGDFSPRMYYTANPGGVGHAWFKRLFVDREYRGSERAEDYAFIPARVYDNDVLMKANPEYARGLENLPADLRRAHLEGNWDVFAGQFFPEFSVDRHVIEPRDIPLGAKLFRSLDYGLDMTACYWWYMIADRLVIYRELHEPNLTLSQAALRIEAMTPRGEEIAYTVASPDLWNRRQGSGQSGMQIMAQYGLKGLTAADNRRVQGWRMLREYLNGVSEFDGGARLQIFSTCVRLIRNLPLLQYDKVRMEDAAGVPHEVTHAPESVRYGVMKVGVHRGVAERKSGYGMRIVDL